MSKFTRKSKSNHSRRPIKTKGVRMGWTSIEKAVKVKLQDTIEEGKVETINKKNSPILVP
ncbi:hypothetical protein OOZ15_12015 [Galbibacter sp. EGI 63066]|uniref:hypothetical protein n=1 Tax=Galbibacter sp. EGI 63066 TaxID=2993559 RepID=UPI0022498F6F|nr:hypothetical protein [Galbibacter sp. EGI 63066]MCX2680670.1 hypothetical protein [Galbibacter sp. EGI 63066]